MRTSSRKAKGRRLQNWVRDELLSRFKTLTDEDVYCAIIVESGADKKHLKEYTILCNKPLVIVKKIKYHLE